MQVAFCKFVFQFQQLNTDPIYEGCGETKTCFGLPNNCVNNQNCAGMVTVEVRGEKFLFELKSNASKWYHVAVFVIQRCQRELLLFQTMSSTLRLVYPLMIEWEMMPAWNVFQKEVMYKLTRHGLQRDRI